MKNIISTIISIATCTFLAQFSDCYAACDPTLPGGSYAQSCQGCTVTETTGNQCTLSCQCLIPGGTYMSSGMNLTAVQTFYQTNFPADCPAGTHITLKNLNGRLVVEACK